jgi:thioredoxin-like negative regulator of GroEL
MSVAGRTILLVAVAVLVMVTVIAVRAWSRRRVSRLEIDGHARLWSALEESPDGRPSLVVFSTPSCTACLTAQHPAVEAVAKRFGQALRIVRVDLSKRPAVGQAFRVLTAPTTVILSGDGRIASFNHGFATADQLEDQVGAARSSPR